MRSPSTDGVVLSVDRCRTLLSQHSFGRVGLSIDALPVVLPVSYGFDGMRIVIRSGPDRKLRMALRDAVVCFEIDGAEHFGSPGWCVLVTGIAEQVRRDDHSFAIGVDRITGRWLPGELFDPSERHGPADGCAPSG